MGCFFSRIVAFDDDHDDDLSPVRSAMCDIVLLSAVKESIHLEEEQATISNEKKVRIERQSKSIFLPVFLGFFLMCFFVIKKRKSEQKTGEKESPSSISTSFHPVSLSLCVTW